MLLCADMCHCMCHFVLKCLNTFLTYVTFKNMLTYYTINIPNAHQSTALLCPLDCIISGAIKESLKKTSNNYYIFPLNQTRLHFTYPNILVYRTTSMSGPLIFWQNQNPLFSSVHRDQSANSLASNPDKLWTTNADIPKRGWFRWHKNWLKWEKMRINYIIWD